MDMTGSTTDTRSTYTALIYELDSALAMALKDGLASCHCVVLDAGVNEDRLRADMVFCPAVPDLLSKALRQFRGKPVVVVSRLPEVEGWLDALEVGAADYCAAPFEQAQLNWLLDTHLRQRKAIAAA